MTEKVEINDREMHRLSKMSTTELITECINLKIAVNKADDRADFFMTKCTEVLKEYELLKLKYGNIDQAQYNPKWSWVNKIVYVIRKVERPLTSPELIELITPHELGLMHSHHPAQAFSSNLNKAVKYQRVIAYKLGGSRGYYYVLPEWMEETGKLKREYEEKIFFK